MLFAIERFAVAVAEQVLNTWEVCREGAVLVKAADHRALLAADDALEPNSVWL